MMFLLETVDVGWLGGGAAGASAIVTALVVIFKFREANIRELIEVHKQRAQDAESRTKEVTEVLATDLETKKVFAQAMNAVADGNKAVAQALTLLANAIKERP